MISEFPPYAQNIVLLEPNDILTDAARLQFKGGGGRFWCH